MSTTVGVLVELLAAPPPSGPVAADAVQALHGAAGHLATVRRTLPEPASTPLPSSRVWMTSAPPSPH